MHHTDNLFVQSKIDEIGTALFFSNSSALPFPAYIITALKTNEEGAIWFFVSRGWNLLKPGARSFLARLEFYRKGYPFTLKIEGSAQIENDLKLMQDLFSIPLTEELQSAVLLVKVKIENVVYKELLSKKPFRPFTAMYVFLERLFHTHKKGRFNMPRLQHSI